MNLKIFIQLIPTLLFLLSLSTSAELRSSKISAFVYSTDNEPIYGATITTQNQNGTIASTFSNEDGLFAIEKHNLNEELIVEINALGYERYLSTFSELPTKVYLKTKSVQLPPINVSSQKIENKSSVTISEEQITIRSRSSIISNNPIAAVRQPQMLKQGSMHSSKIRINGSVPEFYFNGNPIGDDPNHYGMFSIIPASLAGDIEFYPSGTPANYQSPTILDISGVESFEERQSSQFDFSAVQTTGTYSYGTESYFTSFAVRKSVLDKIVKYVNYSSDRRTTPPTNFQDIALTSGYKLSNKSTLYFDFLNSYDHLEYNTDATENNRDGLSTYQHTKFNYTGLRLKIVEPNRLYNFELSRKATYEEYTASPPMNNNLGLDINLKEENYMYSSKINVTTYSTSFDINIGAELHYIPHRKTELDQQNWNFLSPDAPSNNQFIYQTEINRLYNRYTITDRTFNSSMYTSVMYHKNKLEIETGLRFDKFSQLNHSGDISFRNNISYTFNNNRSIALFYGTFSESPVNDILENYQVLIRSDISKQKPKRTKLLSLTYKQNRTTFSLFGKKISDIPEPVFDLSKVSSSMDISNGFISMKPDGQLRFFGSDISYHHSNLFNSKLDFYTYYGYTYSKKKSHYTVSDYELNAPHKFYLEMFYPLTSKVTIGSEFSFRSGYAYTPHLEWSDYESQERYSNDYINHISSFTNSEHFPTFYTLNLSCNYHFGDTELFFGVSNVTNRANPVVATSDGYVYDAGIMPSIGFKWKL